jgi:hypothetical protein
MRRLSAAVLIASGSLIGAAHAASIGCPQPGSPLSHSEAIAQNPTVPATIGGCGTGAYKLHQYKKHLKKLQDEQQMIGPKATGSGEGL